MIRFAGMLRPRDGAKAESCNDARYVGRSKGGGGAGTMQFRAHNMQSNKKSHLWDPADQLQRYLPTGI